MSRSFCYCTGGTNDLDHTSKIAIILSAMVIFTTIQAQDFQDVAGDQASNRITFPIYAPEFSRFFTLLTIPLWSLTLCWFWNIGWSVGAVYVGLGGYVGARYYYNCSQEEDEKSFIIFNVRWIILSTTWLNFGTDLAHVFSHSALSCTDGYSLLLISLREKGKFTCNLRNHTIVPRSDTVFPLARISIKAPKFHKNKLQIDPDPMTSAPSRSEEHITICRSTVHILGLTRRISRREWNVTLQRLRVTDYLNI